MQMKGSSENGRQKSKKMKKTKKTAVSPMVVQELKIEPELIKKVKKIK